MSVIRRHNKHVNQTKFLEDACAWIEYVNLVEDFRLKHNKLVEGCICKERNVNVCNEIKDNQRKSVKSSRLECNRRTNGSGRGRRSERQHAASRRHRSTRSNPAVKHYKTKSIELQPRPQKLNLKENYKQSIDNHKIGNGIKDLTSKSLIRSQKLPHSTSSPKKVKNVLSHTANREMARKLLSSNFDLNKYMQLYCLKDLLQLNEHNNADKKPDILLPKEDYSKCGLKTRKNICILSDSLLLNKSTKRRIKKPQKVAHQHSIKSVVKEPSLHLMLNMHAKPISNTLKLRIKSSVFSTTAQKLGRNKKSFLKKRKSRNLKVRMPFGKTQAVFNVYNVAPSDPLGRSRGLKSRLSFNLDFDNRPPPAPTTYTDTSTPQSARMIGKPWKIRYKNRVNMNSGMGSLQQSLAIMRRDPQSLNYSQSGNNSQSVYSQQPGNFFSEYESSEPCDCAPMDEADLSTLCDSCCHEEPPPPEDPYADYQSSMAENAVVSSLVGMQRTKQGLINTGYDVAAMVLSPQTFLQKVQETWERIKYKVEQQQQQERSTCTCGNIDTDRFTISEDSGCSFLKRCFGELIYNDKCASCITDDRVESVSSLKQKYECTPGICVADETGILACINRFYRKFKKDPFIKEIQAGKRREEKLRKQLMKQKLNEQKRMDKEKKRRAREIRKEKKRKERERIKAEKLKLKMKRQLERCKRGETGKTPMCKFFRKIFNIKTAEDKRKLLKGKGKYKTQKGADDTEPSTGNVVQDTARRGLRTGKRQFRRATKRIRDRYYRNKKLAEKQKGRYACDFYLMSLRNRPCLWVYYMCPFFYPYCLQLLNLWRQLSDVLLFFVAILVWSPCIFMAEIMKALACNLTTV